MSNIAIRVENLGKRYIIHHKKKESCKTFQDVLVNGGKKVIISLNPFAKTSTVKLTDPSKLNTLGWKHTVELDDGIREMYEWYLEKENNEF